VAKDATRREARHGCSLSPYRWCTSCQAGPAWMQVPMQCTRHALQTRVCLSTNRWCCKKRYHNTTVQCHIPCRGALGSWKKSRHCLLGDILNNPANRFCVQATIGCTCRPWPKMMTSACQQMYMQAAQIPVLRLLRWPEASCFWETLACGAARPVMCVAHPTAPGAQTGTH